MTLGFCNEVSTHTRADRLHAQEWREAPRGRLASHGSWQPRAALTSRDTSLTAPASATRPVVNSIDDFMAALLRVAEGGGDGPGIYGRLVWLTAT
jgi:hypothetical protein